MSDVISFIKKEKHEENALALAEAFASIIKGPCGQIQYWTEPVPRNQEEETEDNKGEKNVRFRFDIHYLGFNGFAAPGTDWNDPIRKEILSLINRKTREVLNNPDVVVEIDRALPQVYTTFLVYV